MNLVLFNFHDVVLLLTMGMYFTLVLSHISLVHVSRLSFISLSFFCFASAAIPLDILISFGASFREFAVERFPHAFFIFDMGYWIQAPLWYIFLKSLIKQQSKLHWSDFILFIPFLFFVLHQTFSFYLLSTSKKIMVLNNHLPDSFSIQYVVLLREILRLIVFALSLNIIAKHLAVQKNEKSPFLHVTPWPVPLTFGLFALSCISVIDIFSILLAESGHSVFADTLGLTANYLTLIILFIVVIIAINSDPLLRKYGSTENAKITSFIDQNHALLIEKTMQEDKLFLENNLNLETLANHIGLSPRAVSLVLNRHFNCNFFEYVNKYRINEAKRMMDDAQYSDCNIMDIMLETGFNNKATFNTFFKKTLGMTPREYRKRQATLASD